MPDLIIWPEVPGPIYYYRDPQFHEEATNLARYSHAYFLVRNSCRNPQTARR